MKKLSFATVQRDINAGLVVFFVAIPLCLGIASASTGAPLMSGLIAGMIGGVVIGILGGSQLGVSGPAAGLVATVIAGIAALGGFETFCLATMIAGVLQLLLGAVGAGRLAEYFPTSVIKGMLAAIGIIIILKEIPHLVGYDKDYLGDLDFFQADGANTFTELGRMVGGITPSSVVIGIICMALLILWEQKFIQNNRVLRLAPGPLLAVLVGVGMQVLFELRFPEWKLEPEHLVNIPTDSSPADWFHLPDFGNFSTKVLGYGIIIALVASVETLLSTEATDRIDPLMRVSNKNRELLAQGTGNFLSGLLGGLPITQVIVRTSANVNAGGQTRLATIVHGSLIFLAVLLVPQLLNEIPMASLAAILVLVGYKLAKPSLFKKYYKKGWSQFIPFVVTIVAVNFSDLLTGVGIGIAVAIFFILRRNFRAPFTYEHTEEDGRPVITLKLSSIVSFLNKGAMVETLDKIPTGSKVIIDATECGLIDPDVVEVIEDFLQAAPSRHIHYQVLGTLDHSQQVKNPAKELKKELANKANSPMPEHQNS